MIRQGKVSGRKVKSGKNFTYEHTGHAIDNLHISNNIMLQSSNSNHGSFAMESNFFKSNNLSIFLKIYFEFAYYICISPFRFQERNGEAKKFVLKMWKPQQFVCIVINSLCIFRIITEARLNTPVRSDKYIQSPELYFQLIMNLFNIGYKVAYIKRLLLNKECFLNLMNFVAQEKALLPIALPKLLTSKAAIKTVLFLNIGMAILSLIAGKYFVVGGFLHWSPSWWYRRLVASTRYAFFYGERLPNKSAPEFIEITLIDNCMSVIHLAGLVARYILGYFTDLLVLVLAITLWSAARSFSKSLASGNNPCVTQSLQEYEAEQDKNLKWAEARENPDQLSKGWNQIYKNFKAIRLLSFMVNQALGSTVGWFLGNAIFAYSLSMDAVFVARDIHRRIGLVFNYFCAFGILFVSADICKQMEAIKLWLKNDENRKNVSTDQVNIVLYEMLIKDIGIRGGNIFTITYPIVATFIGTILTYFIICVQQNSSTEL